MQKCLPASLQYEHEACIHPLLIVCFEVFHCEIHGMVPLLQINMLPFYCLQKWEWGQLYAGMDGDRDNLETSCGIGVGMGIRVPGSVGMCNTNIYPRAALYARHLCVCVWCVCVHLAVTAHHISFDGECSALCTSCIQCSLVDKLKNLTLHDMYFSHRAVNLQLLGYFIIFAGLHTAVIFRY